jgi:8-oxo-dGTP diphosphatase
VRGLDCPACGQRHDRLACPACGAALARAPYPLLTVDCIVRNAGGAVLLVQRRFPPHGWALPGGFVELGETLETAVVREVLEETGLRIENFEQFRAYSDPARDARHHIITIVFTGWATGEPRGADDAAEAKFFPMGAMPEPLAADHGTILADFRAALAAGRIR